MRLVSALILFTALHLSAKTSAQKVSLNSKNISIEKALESFKAQTGYSFIWNDQLIVGAPHLDLHLHQVTLKDALNACFEKLPISYNIVNKLVYLKSKPTFTNIEKQVKVIVQQYQIHGKVTDTTGKAIGGVSVVIVGTKKGTITDGNGDYEITVDKGNMLQFSYVGFKAQNIVFEKQSTINISLVPVTAELEEMVVVGYGKTKRSDLTGAVSTVNASSYKDQPIVDISSALQGRVAGVSVSNSSGAPGADVKIRIRGANSVNYSNNPLYVVDGIALGSANFSQLNVDDIASMEILKDASATAIYGSRGANGVVIITTKKGKISPPEVTYKGFLSFNSPMNKYDLMNPLTYATIANLNNPGSYPNAQQYASTQATNWQDLIIKKSSTQSHQLSITGGTENSKYYVSAFYVDQGGLLLNTSQKKFGARFNINLKLSKRLTADADVYLARFNAHNNSDIGSKGNPVMSAIAWPTLTPVYDSLGNYNAHISSPIWAQPYMTLKERDNNTFSNVGVFNGHAKYEIAPWLSLNIRAGLDMSIIKNAYFNDKWITNASPSAGESSSDNYTFQNSNSLEFNKTFGRNSLNAVAVLESTSNKFDNFLAAGTGLTSSNYSYYNLGLAAAQAIQSGYSNWSLLSYIGRINYTYNDKYLLTATIRRDGSSKFQGNNKWGTFPSFGFGWKASNEQFIKNLNLFSNLKIRGGWGITGNQAVPPYSTLGLLSSMNFSYGTTTPSTGYGIGNPSSDNLKWETTKQADLGVDMSFLKNALSFSFDYYDKKTTGLLLDVPITNYNGGGTMLQNIGSIRNKGFEFSINATPIATNNFSWNTNFNFATNRNKVLNLGGADMIKLPWLAGGLISTNIQVVKVGQPLGSFYLIPWEGVYQANDGAHKAGDPKYTDVSGNGTIGFEDQKIVGSAMPKYQFGFNNTFTYKNFDLNIFIQSSQGNKIFNATYAAAAVPTSDVANITLADAANYWTSTNTGSTWANPANHTKSWVESTQFLQDGSYIRLKNVSLSYNINKKYLKFAAVKVFASAQNLATITKYKGFDPEATSTPSTSDSNNGIDVGAYPSPKTITVGIQLNF
ncbi:SusC/RagA family TonB-linked outer membrane protein [Arachidicoccus sp.]|uniref:SusC/RagA family TonB-linked outer membrane protein n=1 Tax=Arachidicoccus sp. TaxID=1872624 RepID=UPI003D236429